MLSQVLWLERVAVCQSVYQRKRFLSICMMCQLIKISEL
ncbi:hypothetical protein [Citrobacter freundii]|uniref:Uncharacterized protein n=1 Tax=Citrobacter freundii TaxID=546 RepID=A0A7G2IQ69_CITFR|nr:hypothetical protein [Citrobacter freundii]